MIYIGCKGCCESGYMVILIQQIHFKFIDGLVILKAHFKLEKALLRGFCSLVW